jgi:hypothetical protein
MSGVCALRPAVARNDVAFLYGSRFILITAIVHILSLESA